MARPIRVDVIGGWYHVTARGIERRAIFAEPREYEHFLDLLAEMVARYGVEVHAYALMGNHYHLLIRTPRANASSAIQWLNVSYSVWFNKRRERVGHVFQGRFGSVLIDGENSWVLAASIYVHLNPVRVASLGLGKRMNRAESRGLAPPERDAVKRRLKRLRDFTWSSYRAFAGYSSVPEWLTTEALLARGGGVKRYRREVQQHVTRGEDPEGFEDLSGRLALGSRAFLAEVKNWSGRVTKEQPARKQLKRQATVDQVVKLVEAQWGQPWDVFANRHGDWGRDLVIYLARKRSGLTLRQIGDALGGLEYKTVGKAAQRAEASIGKDSAKRKVAEACLRELSFVET